MQTTLIKWFLGAALGLSLTACATDGDAPGAEGEDELIGEEEEKEEEETPSGVAMTEDCEEDDETTCEEEEEEPIVDVPEEAPEEPLAGILDDPEAPEIPLITDVPGETPPPIAAFEPEPTPQTTPQQQAGGWTPKNDGGRPERVTQADLRIECHKIGEGLEAGFYRYGCKAYKRADGQHYGIVKGWWQVRKRDGSRARSRDLNFREAGYDMAFDVWAPDAAAGIMVRPGRGEEKPIARH